MTSILKVLKNIVLAVVESLFLFFSNYLPRIKAFDWVRCYFLRIAGVKMTGRYTVFSGVDIRPVGGAKNIVIGKGTFINSGVRFAAPNATITIGENCSIGPRVMFETVSHGLVYDSSSGGRGSISKSITLEDEVWLGAGVIVTQGVRVGRGAVVAAGAVVTKDIPPMVLSGGVPASVIRNL